MRSSTTTLASILFTVAALLSSADGLYIRQGARPTERANAVDAAPSPSITPSRQLPANYMYPACGGEFMFDARQSASDLSSCLSSKVSTACGTSPTAASVASSYAVCSLLAQASATNTIRAEPTS